MPDPGVQETALQNLRPDTLISQLGLSTRAQNIVERLGMFNAKDLAAHAPGKSSTLGGVGNKPRREIMDLVGKRRGKLPQSAIPERSTVASTLAAETEPSAPLTVDAVTAMLVAVESSPSGKVGRQIIAAFLELDDNRNEALLYPTQAQIAKHLAKTRAQIGQVITKARDRWRRSVPALTPIRTELAEYLAAEGGVAEIGRLATFLLASRRSDAPEPIAVRRAAAVVRAALEAERISEKCQFEERPHASVFLVARAQPPFGEPALDYAEKLGEAGIILAGAGPPPSPTPRPWTL